MSKAKIVRLKDTPLHSVHPTSEKIRRIKKLGQIRYKSSQQTGNMIEPASSEQHKEISTGIAGIRQKMKAELGEEQYHKRMLENQEWFEQHTGIQVRSRS